MVYTLALHDALPISLRRRHAGDRHHGRRVQPLRAARDLVADELCARRHGQGPPRLIWKILSGVILLAGGLVLFRRGPSGRRRPGAGEIGRAHV